MSSIIEIENVSKEYESDEGSVTALKDINFKVNDGEFITIVGPSGCGKTTLLHMITNVINPTTGSINLRFNNNGGKEGEISIVFQEPVLLPWKSSIDNVVFPLELLGKDPDTKIQRAEELMELVGLKGFEDKKPYELSGGMQQRVSLCRALITDPSLVLMDEPFGALDAQTRIKLDVDLQELWQKQKSTILFVTHDVEEAITLGDRVLVLSERPGKIIWEEKIDLPRPRTWENRTRKKFEDYCSVIYEKLGF